MLQEGNRPYFSIDLRIATRRLPWSTEEQDVAIRVRNLEASKSIARILQGLAECCAITRKFRGEPIRVFYVEECVPSHVAMALGVRQWRHTFLGLDENLRSVAADDGGPRVPIRLLPSGLKAKLVAVKSDGLFDIADDEEW